MKVNKLTQLLEAIKKPKAPTKKQIEELFGKAMKKDKSILSDPNVSIVRDSDGDTPLHVLAMKKVGEVLDHPDVATTHNKDSLTPLHILASLGVRIGDVLDHPKVSSTHNQYDETPLHLIGRMGYIGAIKHPDVSKVKDNPLKDTPLHYLVSNTSKEDKASIAELLKHKDIAEVKNAVGNTPLHYMADLKYGGAEEIMSHPLMDSIKNNSGETPLDLLAHSLHTSKEYLLKEWGRKHSPKITTKPKVEID